MRFGQQQSTARLISLTPLIDVVFILLIFFMLTTSFLDWRSVDLSVSSGVDTAESADRAILIDLLADGSMTVGSSPVTIRALPSVLKTKLAGNPEQRVVIRSEPGVPLQRAIDALDLIRATGAINVSLTRTR